MQIIFSEITNKTGPINKTINADGSKSPKANVKDAICRTVRLPIEEFKFYLENIGTESEKAIILGITGHDEIGITTKDNPVAGKISRSKEFFKFCNSDQVGLILLDIDDGSEHGSYTEDEIKTFLKDLFGLLEFSLIGENKSNTICRFERHSGAAGVFKDGKAIGDGYHIYIPVKNPTEELLELIFDWAWLSGLKSYKISATGSVLERSIIDVAVKSPERLVFESDCSVEDPFEVRFRECKFTPGGVIDSELAKIKLEAEIERIYVEQGFSSIAAAKAKYTNEVKKSPEVTKRRKEYIEKETEKLSKTKKISKAAAREIIKKRDNFLLLSSDYIILNDMTEVSVYEILANPSEWHNRNDIRSPFEPDYGPSKAKIFLNDDESVILHSFAHGGQIYRLAHDCLGVLEWIKESDLDEVKYNYETIIANAVLDEDERDEVAAAVQERLGNKLTAIKKKVAAAQKKTVEETVVDGENIVIEPSATHFEIASDLFNKFGKDCVVYGQTLYAFEKTIWKSMPGHAISYKIASTYGHCGKCETKSDYNGIYRTLMEIVSPNRGGYKEKWESAFGIPCANYLWKFDFDKRIIEPVKYLKEHGIRHKIGFEPDFEMPMPMFEAYLRNVANPECLQKLLGLTLCGVMVPKLQQVGVLKGPGGTGKGTITRILTSLYSASRVISMNISSFNNPQAVKDLVDAEIAIIPEADNDGDINNNNRYINLSGFKKATGGDPMRGKVLYHDEFSFTPKTSYLMSMNNWPRINSFHTETSRRLSSFIVEFKREHEEVIFGLEDKIIEHELPAILAWMINGVRKWCEDDSQDIRSFELFNEWRKSVDTVYSFFSEKVIIKKGSKGTLKPVIHEAYKRFCTENGFEPVTSHILYNWLRQNGCREGRVTKGELFLDIELLR